MRLGYNTNGLACHRWQDAIRLLADIGYTSVALTLDHDCLDPWSPHLPRDTAQMRLLLERLGLACVVETGARYLLNPLEKHQPTLVSTKPEERALRLDFLMRAVDIAREIGAPAVSFWSGAPREPFEPNQALENLADGCQRLLDHASKFGVALAFEPEPGMLVDTLETFRDLLSRVDAPHFLLTLDVGHVHCMGEGPIADRLREWAPRLANVHIEDMCRGAHEHLRFGEGEIDFAPVMATLAEIGYAGGVHVELSRHSHIAPEVARESFAYLSALLQKGAVLHPHPGEPPT
jgi:sugar phosphate isomerase/epimerase